MHICVRSQEIYSTAPPVSEQATPPKVKDIQLIFEHLDGRNHLLLVKIMLIKRRREQDATG